MPHCAFEQGENRGFVVIIVVGAAAADADGATSAAAPVCADDSDRVCDVAKKHGQP